MADTSMTSMKVDAETRDRFAAVAAARGESLRAYLAELAIEEENQVKLRTATQVFRDVTSKAGIAEAFDAAFPDEALAPRDTAGRAA